MGVRIQEEIMKRVRVHNARKGTAIWLRERRGKRVTDAIEEKCVERG